MTRCNKFEECGQCSNLEFDPFACEGCNDLSNFDPIDRVADSDLACDTMSYGEFITWYKKAA